MFTFICTDKNTEAVDIIAEHYRNDEIELPLTDTFELNRFWRIFDKSNLDTFIKTNNGFDDWDSFEFSEHVAKMYNLSNDDILVFADFEALEDEAELLAQY